MAEKIHSRQAAISPSSMQGNSDVSNVLRRDRNGIFDFGFDRILGIWLARFSI
jgi:hypothetical protein